MSGSERPSDPREHVGEPTRYAPTDFMSRHEAAEGHGDHRDRNIREISAELNRRSEFVQELQRHAERHRHRPAEGPDEGPTPP
jgi:hypothetical protein